MPRKKPDFVHLHTHSEYSLLDGASRVVDMVSRCREQGMTAMAITDHGNMHAAIPFYTAARDLQIKPIIGCEFYVAPSSRFDKSTKEDRSPYHLTVLAKNETGYLNLIKLNTLGHLEGFYSKPRIDKQILKEYHEGLILLSGCITGEISNLLLAGKFEAAKNVAAEFKEIFGQDFYLEIQDQGKAGQKDVVKLLVEISKGLKIPVVATNDTHYTLKEDAKAQDIMLCIQTGRFVDEENRIKFPTDEFYIKSPEEMENIFKDFPEALSTSLEIAEKCNLTIEIGKMHLPDFPVVSGESVNSYLEKLCTEGIAVRYGSARAVEVDKRLSYELSIIDKMEYAPYFLIVADFIKYAREHNIQVGPGRGSAPGSIVAYALGITDVDPLKYNLIFERFLNPDRVSMPDIDIDFCFERREEVIDYVTKKYGADHVAQIVTFGTMAARAAIRDVGRVQRMPLAEVDRVAKLIPFGPEITIDKALEMISELKKLEESDPRIKSLLETAKSLEGLVRHASVHAAGVVISQKPLTNYVPLQKMNETQIVTQYPMECLEKIGLLKMDFLGLRNLTMIAHAVLIIEHTLEEKIDICQISLSDENTYKLLQSGNTLGIFQLESRGMKSLIRDLIPTHFEDLIALLALYRPGPLESGMVEDFIKRKKGLVKIKYDLVELEPILKETYGVILYQEQVMEIAGSIAGFSMSQADELRRAMGKKKPTEMAKQKEMFVSGAVAKKIPEKKARDLFNLCSKFAGYGFNKSHSTSYAVISYRTAYLKANFPVAFMAALLTSVTGVTDKVSAYILEAKRMGIPVLPPDINESLADFTVVAESIRFGLAAVRNVGTTAIESIISARKKGDAFKSLLDFCRRVDLRTVNKRVMESLIKAGAFDSLGGRRAQTLKDLSRALEQAISLTAERRSGQELLFGEDFQMVMSPAEGEALEVEEFSPQELLKMEKEMLGLYISGHPLIHLKEVLDNKTDSKITDLAEKKDGSYVTIGGLLSGTKKITTRRKEMMMLATLEDFSDSIPVVIFPKVYQKYLPYLIEDAALILKGKLDNRDDELQLVCEEVERISGESNPKIFHVELPSSFSAVQLERIKNMFCLYRGEVRVILHKDGKSVEVGPQYNVNLSPGLILQVENILGEGATWVEYKEVPLNGRFKI